MPELETPNPGETPTPSQPLATNSNPTPAPATDNSELERLRKEAEQAKMRANQLENEARERREKDEADKLKKLEEQNEWQTIAERNGEELKRLQEKDQQRETATAISTAEAELTKDYPANVLELAKTFGASLTGTDEAAQTAFKEKLDAAAKQIGAPAKVPGNNPPNPGPSIQDDTIYYSNLRAAGGLSGGMGEKVHKEAIHGVLSKNRGLAGMRESAGYNPVQQ